MNGITLMGEDIDDIYGDLEADVSREEFEEAVEAKVEQMGGLADEESAAMLVAHELDEGEVEGVADVDPEMDDVQFTAKVVDVGDLREFDRDDGGEGLVLNADVADETGSIRVTFWDAMAEDAADRLAEGDVLAVGGRPQEGYTGVEVSVDDVDPDPEVDPDEIDVQIGDSYDVEDLSLGMSGVTVRGKVLDTDSVRTFDRDDGSEGRVASVTIGDPTGRVRVTLWDDRADLAEQLQAGESVEVVDGYVRERDGDLEVHVNDRSSVDRVDEDVQYEPDATPIADVEIGQRVDIAGVVRTADPKRTFDRDDGSEGQVRNVRVQDDTGDIRVALWGEKADVDLGPGDRVALTDVEIEDGWQDDLEASANWRSTVTPIDEAPGSGAGGGTDDTRDGTETDAGLSEFGDGGLDGGSDAASGSDGGSESGGGTTGPGESGDAASGATAAATTGEVVEFTGTVVQAGDPVVLDDGDRTVSVDGAGNVHLGQEVTVRGRRVEEGRIEAERLI